MTRRTVTPQEAPITDPFADITPSQMDAVVSRAWKEAVTCWSEARACQDASIRGALFDTAASAEAWWEAVRSIARDKWARVCNVPQESDL